MSGRSPHSKAIMGEPPQQNEAEKNIEIWKVKKLIRRLEQARGNGTSMISLIIRKSLPIQQIPVALYADSNYQVLGIRYLEPPKCWLKNTAQHRTSSRE